MGGQGKRVRIVVTPRREVERATTWRLFAWRRSTGPVRRAWYDLTLRAPCGAPYENDLPAADLLDTGKQSCRRHFKLPRQLQDGAQVRFTPAVLIHADRGPVDFGVERQALL